jgi:hypothetical protein
MKHFTQKKTWTIKKQINEKRRLLRPIVKSHGNPVLVHSVHNIETFMKILDEGKLKLPNSHSSPKKTPHMERFLKIDNSIYYSLGFVYSSSYGWRYNLIFDIDYLEDLVFFNKSINFQCYREVVNYWYENDRKYFEKLWKTNRKTKEVINRWLYEEYNGMVRTIFQFWKIEKELYEHIEDYPKKVNLLRIIRKTAKKHKVNYPESKKTAIDCYMEEYAPEIIGKKDNNLLKNPHFLGFYIMGKIPSKLMKVFEEKYSGKILYDGKKIRKI